MPNIDELFKRRDCEPGDHNALSRVRWYRRIKLSGHDQRDLLLEPRNRVSTRADWFADWAGAGDHRSELIQPHVFRGERIHPAARPCRFGRFSAAAERAVRGIAIGRGWGNWTVAGSDAGGHGPAMVPTPIETCELNEADPPAWLARGRAKSRDGPAKRHDEWPPRNWTPRRQEIAEAA
jgi:hypothetical protein